MDYLLSHLILTSSKESKKIYQSKMGKISKEKIYKVIERIEDIAYNQCYIGDDEKRTPGLPLIRRDVQPKKP